MKEFAIITKIVAPSLLSLQRVNGDTVFRAGADPVAVSPPRRESIDCGGLSVAKMLVFDDDARQKVLAGVSKLARAVKSTLGPRGRNAVLDKGWGAPNVTKDGVSVAEEIELKDPYENMGAQLVKEAASKTSDVAGDGTPPPPYWPRPSTRKGFAESPPVPTPWLSAEGFTRRSKRLSSTSTPSPPR